MLFVFYTQQFSQRAGERERAGNVAGNTELQSLAQGCPCGTGVSPSDPAASQAGPLSPAQVTPTRRNLL